MSDEEEKSIKILGTFEFRQKTKNYNKIDLEDVTATKTVLNLITKLQKENEEKDRYIKNKDKQIDLMAEMIDELSEYYTRYHGKNNEFCKEICIEKDIDCRDCIKQYFERKAEDEK